MDYKTANKLYNIFCIIGVGFIAALFIFKEASALFILCAVLAAVCCVAGAVIKSLFYKCPHCRAVLPFRTVKTPDICPYLRRRL